MPVRQDVHKCHWKTHYISRCDTQILKQHKTRRQLNMSVIQHLTQNALVNMTAIKFTYIKYFEGSQGILNFNC